MSIYTSYFANKKMPADIIKVRISIGNPRWKLPYEIAGTIKSLMPTRDMLGLEYDVYKKIYFRMLDAVGIDEIKKALSAFGKKIVLLCFENVTKDDSWCHRRMFAEWYEKKTGTKIPELPC